MSHDAIIESRKILKSSKVKELKKKKKKAMSFNQRRIIENPIPDVSRQNAQEKETKEPTPSQCILSVPVAHT
jgi:hypothetical protein